MDGECVSLLPRVCEVLAASGSSLPDDTSLEKLMDWFTALTKTGESLLESCPCLLKFISTTVDKTSSDPDILSFCLKLTGLIASTEDDFTALQESSVLDLVFNLQHWQEAELWEDPCIRIGWIQGLRTMLQHPKALSFFVQAGFIVPLLQLQTDSSLFVASAAHQMLAHIFLFYQPVSPVGCSGKEKHRGYGDVVTAISAYLKESLLPKEKAQLHQSLQTLRLLALLLAQTRPPLQDELLQTVAVSLEELVSAEYSQLTLPLMDAILAAHSRCGADERVSRLLSLMLNIRKPSDLIQAAAAFLRSGHYDPVHTAQSVRVLLLPLHIITGYTLLGPNVTEEHQFSTVELLKNKSSCISTICVCVTNTPQIALVAPDCLPCPPVSVVAAVVSLLRLCSGDSSSSSAGNGNVFRNVIGSGKVQKCALDALTALSGCPGVKVKLDEVFALLIQYLDNPDSDPTVVHKSYQALIKWVGVCTDLSSITNALRQDFTQVVKKRACDMRWEVRDSTVEFLGHLAGVRPHQTSAEDGASDALLGGCSCTTPLLKEALQDPESYVRASAICALAKTLTRSWQQGAAVTPEQSEIVTRLLEILSQDTEGFARRAVVRYFIAWLSSHSSHPPPSSPPPSLLTQSVRSVLSQGSADLDWEVKVHTLELAELLLDEALSGLRGHAKGSDTRPEQTHPYAVISDRTHALHAHGGARAEESRLLGALNRLVEQGVISALLSGLVDCDRPVGLKACRLLSALRETVCPSSAGDLDATAAMATVAGVSCELPRRGWALEIRKMLEMKNAAKESRLSLDAVEADDRRETGEEDVRVSVCEVLRSLDLEERLDILGQSSDHVHNSPLSLLQDILTASAAHTRPDAQEEVIVDCY